jgi:diguanylate cyclase (GGDEF)-like protein
MDRRTLFTVQAGLLLFLGSVVLFAYRTRKNRRNGEGEIWFGSGFLLAGVGLVLQAQRGLISPLYSILLGNFLYMLVGPFLNRAVARITGQKDQFLPLMSLIPVTIASFAYYTYVRPNLFIRIAEAVVVMSVMHLATIRILLRSRDQTILLATRSMAVLLGFHILPGGLRAIFVTRSANADAWFSLGGCLTIAGMALSFLWVSSLRMESELEQRAMTDPLTGLFNRRALDLIAPRELQRAIREDSPCSALMLDIDRFKAVNDTLGHAAGDRGLCAVAGVFQAILRTSDIATRLGGDEFFILLPDTDEEETAMVVGRLRDAFAALQLESADGIRFGLEISIGQITLRKASLTIEDLLHGSDILLYREKQLSRAGRGLSAAASSPSEETSAARIQASNI